MSPEEASPPPLSPSLRERIPPFAMLWRGVAFAVAALAMLLAAGKLTRRGLPGVAAALPVAGTGILAAWAALIHLTGGEEFDDMPWV